jgi:predicted site-specific integrase-resolvase
MEEQYMSGKKATELLGVHMGTLYLWDKKGKIETIRTPGGKRLYNVKKYLEKMEKNITNVVKVNNEKVNNEMNKRHDIIYARVSSLQQKDDLNRQINVLKENCPNHELITDIASGIKMNRRGLLKIIDYALNNRLNEVVVVHRDRLTRFGYDLINYIITTKSHGTIKILNEKARKEPKEEMVDDILQIMNIFVAKINGLRKYKKI